MTRLSRLTRLACVPRNCSGDLLFFMSAAEAPAVLFGCNESPSISMSHGLFLLLLLLAAAEPDEDGTKPEEHKTQ